MKKRIICLLLALVMFATLPAMSARAFADGDYFEYTVGAETMKIICEKNGLNYDFCKEAIIKLNSVFESEDDFSSKLSFGMTIKLPKSNADAAKIRGVALPADLPSSSSSSSSSGSSAAGDYIEYKIKSGDTAISICKALGLDFGKCKAAIMKLNNYYSDYSFLTLKAGNIIKMPKSNAAAATIAAAAAPATTGAATTGAATGAAATGTAAAAALSGADYVAAYLVPYVVKAGETLYGICVANGVDYSRYADLIVQASSIKSANWIHAGDVLYIPSSTAAANGFTIVAHTVKAGETTYGICQSLGIDYSARANMIAALNPGKNLSSIRLGQLLLFPSGKGAATGTAAGAATGAASGYVPAASTTASTTPTVASYKPKTGVNFYFKEITVKKDDTIYNLVKAAGFEYTTYYADVLLAANRLGTFNNLKEGDKLLMLSSSAAGASYAVTGVTVKSGDTLISICESKNVSYALDQNLIAKLNPSLNVNNMRAGDIVLVSVKL